MRFARTAALAAALAALLIPSTAHATPAADLTEDQDPATWLPSAAGYRCQYVTDWIADKTRWGLTIGVRKPP